MGAQQEKGEMVTQGVKPKKVTKTKLKVQALKTLETFLLEGVNPCLMSKENFPRYKLSWNTFTVHFLLSSLCIKF